MAARRKKTTTSKKTPRRRAGPATPDDHVDDTGRDDSEPETGDALAPPNPTLGDDTPPEGGGTGGEAHSDRRRRVLRDPITGQEVSLEDDQAVRHLILRQVQRVPLDGNPDDVLGETETEEIASRMIEAFGSVQGAVDDLERSIHAHDAVTTAIASPTGVAPGRAAAKDQAVTGAPMNEYVKQLALDRIHDLVPKLVSHIEDTEGREPATITVSVKYKPGGTDRDPVFLFEGKVTGKATTMVRYARIREVERVDAETGEEREGALPKQLHLFVIG